MVVTSRLIDKQPGLLEALDELVHPETRGNPMSLLRWTSKSTHEAGRRAGPPGLSRCRLTRSVRACCTAARLLAAGHAKVNEGTPASRSRRPVPLPERQGRQPSSTTASR